MSHSCRFRLVCEMLKKENNTNKKSSVSHLNSVKFRNSTTRSEVEAQIIHMKSVTSSASSNRYLDHHRANESTSAPHSIYIKYTTHARKSLSSLELPSQ